MGFMMTGDLFNDAPSTRYDEILADGAVLLHGFALTEVTSLYRSIEAIVSSAPFRHMTTPGGYRMSVAMLNCGSVGWVSDRHGYRYQKTDPESWQPWPVEFIQLAERAGTRAGYADFVPDCYLVNRYECGAKLSLHQDKDEGTYDSPIVSVSLGLPAKFLFGGLTRKDPVRRLRLDSGDVVVWGGVSRLVYHGVDTLAAGDHEVMGQYRFNLTFRKAVSSTF
jgi:alkylated DNA repair protein (DNA oxidative demethylase)